MIRPTLFVGLGTTGTEILKKLRELMNEEYGLGGLPIFRYIAIETDGNMEVGNTNQMKDYERINFVKATIENFAMINRKLDSTDILYNEHFDDWLNRDVLTFAKNFTAGAAHIRMAGRLCLWENWGQISGTIAKAHGAIIAPASIKNANDILEQHFKTKGFPVDGNIDGDNIHIYVVGSLCGGTCSGMMTDMAYHCRNLIGVKDGNEIHGIFTMHDRRAATDDDALTDVRSANCYASLWELNYYNHLQTTYDVILPNSDGKVASPEKIPFDNTMLVSCSGKEQNNQFVDEDGNLDLDGLNLMMALNLFAETAGNTRGLKDAMGINGRALKGYGTEKIVKKGETTVMMRSMASFGLTAVWYPKYRIASASASLVSQELCDNWLASHITQATIVKNAKNEWDRILKGNIDTLATPENQTPIKSRILTHLGRAKQQWLKNETSSNQLSLNMENYPIGNSFKKKFVEGGEYVDLMKMQVPECKKNLSNAIEQILNNQLGNIDFVGTHGLDDVKMFFETLDKEIENTIQQCPAMMPSLDLKKLDFEPIDRAINSFWLKSIFLHDKSVNLHRNNIIDQYCNLIIGSRTSFYESVRNYFLGPILQEIRTELGFGVSPMDEDRPSRTQTIKQRLDQIDANLNKCLEKFKEEYSKAINPRRSECVKIVANNEENRIDTDATILSHQIKQLGVGNLLLDGVTMTSFLQKDTDDIFDQMFTTYRRMSLSQIKSHDVVQEVQKQLGTGAADIPNLANRSNPYQTFDNDYKPLLNIPPKIIFGHDPKNNVLPALEGKLGFPNSGASSVDHLLFYYQEEYGFTIDDLGVYRLLKQQYDGNPLGKYGHSTHQEADFYNLDLYDKIRKLQRWCQVLARLVPEICNRIDENAFDGVFRLDYGRYVFDYRIDSQLESLGLNNHQDGIKMLSSIKNTDAYNEFIESVQSKFMILGREKIIENIINPMLLEVENLNTRTKLSRYFNQFLDEVYSDNVFTDTADADDDFESYFSNVNFPTHENTQSQEAPSTSAEPNQNVPNEAAENTTADLSDDYGDVNVEETEVETGTFNQTDSTSGTEDHGDNTDANESTVSSDDTTDEVVWTEAAPETEHSSTEEATEEEPSPEQQPHPEVVPETDTQQKQQKPAKPFSVADVDPKILRRDSPRKKE